MGLEDPGEKTDRLRVLYLLVLEILNDEKFPYVPNDHVLVFLNQSITSVNLLLDQSTELQANLVVLDEGKISFPVILEEVMDNCFLAIFIPHNLIL